MINETPSKYMAIIMSKCLQISMDTLVKYKCWSVATYYTKSARPIDDYYHL